MSKWTSSSGACEQEQAPHRLTAGSGKRHTAGDRPTISIKQASNQAARHRLLCRREVAVQGTMHMLASL